MNLLAAHMPRLVMPDVYDGCDKRVRSEGPHPNEGIPLSPRADIGSTLALLTSQVQPPPYPPTGVGHDPQPRLQYSSHHCNVGAVPQQPPIAQLAVFGKTGGFRVSVHAPQMHQVLAGACCLQHAALSAAKLASTFHAVMQTLSHLFLTLVMVLKHLRTANKTSSTDNPFSPCLRNLPLYVSKK